MPERGPVFISHGLAVRDESPPVQQRNLPVICWWGLRLRSRRGVNWIILKPICDIAPEGVARAIVAAIDLMV